jgi:aspartokinase
LHDAREYDDRIDGAALIERMEQGQVPVVAGFQGIDPKRNRITTLGRGGSDLYFHIPCCIRHCHDIRYFWCKFR